MRLREPVCGAGACCEAAGKPVSSTPTPVAELRKCRRENWSDVSSDSSRADIVRSCVETGILSEATHHSISAMNLPLPADARNLRSFKREIIHQPLRIEDEPNHRARDLVGI